MTDFLYSIIDNMTIPKAIVLSITFCVIFITMFSLLVNFQEWILKIYLYAKIGWFQLRYPNFNEKIIKIKYENYIVGYPSGEIFYIDKRKLKKLKRKKLVTWSNFDACYIFKDENVEKIKNTISPLIFYETRRCVYDVT